MCPRAKMAGVVVALLLIPIVSLYDWKQAKQVGGWSADFMYVFSDRSDARLEHLYVVRGSEVVAQVSGFPGYSDPKWYRVEKVSGEEIDKIREWVGCQGDLSPPFEPHGPWFSRMTLNINMNERGEAFFRNENEKMQECFAFLRQKFVKEELTVDRLPDWILADEQVKRYFAIRE